MIVIKSNKLVKALSEGDVNQDSTLCFGDLIDIKKVVFKLTSFPVHAHRHEKINEFLEMEK